jgi:hypothetical protein
VAKEEKEQRSTARDPKATAMALRFDKKRRELFVEGIRDVSFLKHIGKESLGKDTVFRDGRSIKIDGVFGGVKGRLIRFAAEVEQAFDRFDCSCSNARFFVDADNDRLLEKQHATIVWLTDRRDLEGYVLQPNVLERAFELGFEEEDFDGSQLLSSLTSACKDIGSLRLLSERDDLKLPFQDTDLKKFVEFEQFRINFDFARYREVLFHKLALPKQSREAIEKQRLELLHHHQDSPRLELVHGKDAFRLLELLVAKRYKIRDPQATFWAAFDPQLAKNFRNLERVLQFVAGPGDP